MSDDRRANDPLPVLVMLDLEPDPFIGGRPDEWTGAARALDLVDEVRPAIEAATGRPARFSWMVRCDRHVAQHCGAIEFAVRHFSEQLLRNRALGDLVGVHIHVFDGEHRFEDWSDHRVLADELASSVVSFRSTLGVVPDAVGFARGFTCDEAVRVCREYGVPFDVSAVAESSPPNSLDELDVVASMPDLRRLPRLPYHPSPDDWLQADPTAGPPLIVPLTAVNPLGWMSRLSRLRMPSAYRRRHDKTRKGYLMMTDERGFARHLRAAQRDGTPYLTLSARSHRFVDMEADEFLRLFTRIADIAPVEFGTPAVVGPTARPAAG